jgi:hypothetical protein
MPHVSGHGRPGFSSSRPSKPKKPKKPSSSVNQGPPSGSGSSGSSSYGQSGNNQSNTQASLPPSMGFNPTSNKPPSSGLGFNVGFNTGQVDPGLASAVVQQQTGVSPQVANMVVQQNMGSTGQGFGITNTGNFGIGNIDIPPGSDTPPDDDTTVDPEDDDKLTEEEKKEKEKKDKALETAKELTDWWKKNNKGGYRAYGDRTTIGGKVRNSQEAVTAKIQDKLNKGYYKIVDGPNGEPLIIHASTGTPVNPYTGGIISTQTQQDQGGAYQNEMAKITGIDPKFAGVFSKEYQTGNGLSVSEMKPEHALRFLMKKNKGAFEQFFNMNKDKAGFNPFSASFISQGFGALLNMITGPEALQVGNNLERAGWGKAIKGEDGKYKIQLTEKGAKNWSDSFNFDTVNIGDKTFTGFTSPEAITKDKSKGYLSELLGTKKFPDQPVDLTNLMEQGGYFQGSDLMPGQTGQPYDPNTFDPMNPQGANLNTLDPNLNPNVAFQPQYGYMPPITAMGSDSPLPGTPPSQYPEFTPGGYKISSYNPSVNYGNQSGGGQDQGQGGGGGQDQDTTTPPPGPLTFDVYGRPITYNYTGGPEQIYLGGGYKRDGQYIGSPYGFSKGGIANFKPYGY